jgi:hypothetical protein
MERSGSHTGKGTVGQVDPTIQAGELSNQTALTKIAGEQAQNSQTLFNMTEPGLVQSEDFYQNLQSGDPAAIMKAIAPTAQAASSSAAGAKANIMANDPAGGEKNLALEQADLTRGAQISSAASGATLAAPNALGQIAGQGIGEGISSAGAATSGLSASNQGFGQMQSQQFQGQQLQMEQKGQTLGALGGLAGDATQLGVGYMNNN